MPNVYLYVQDRRESRLPRPPYRHFELEHVEVDAAWLLLVRGELDIARAPKLGVAINQVLRLEPRALVIDLCEVDFVDSIGLAVLLHARRRALRRGVSMKLVCNVPSTLKLLRLTRLERDFEVYESREQALEALRADGAADRSIEASVRPRPADPAWRPRRPAAG